MRPIDADALKICLQDHYDVIEQDCSISEEFADGAISGIDAAMFEIDAAPTVPAITVEWLWKAQDRMLNSPRYSLAECAIVGTLIKAWQREQEEGNK